MNPIPHPLLSGFDFLSASAENFYNESGLSPMHHILTVKQNDFV